MAPKNKKAVAAVESKDAGEKVEEPAAKKAKADEADVVKEAPKEQEEDAKADTRPKLKEQIGFETPSTTLNVVPTLGGKVLMTLTEGGMQYLVAGARANVGVKSGRYFFEAKIVEQLSQFHAANDRAPKQLVRVGFSTADESLIIGDNSCISSVCFDSDGFFSAGKRTKTGGRFGRDTTVGVLLNLETGSPNANTVSLFRNGVRSGEPQPLPEALHGKTLFPHVAFRGVSLQVHFGPEPLKQLPFKCHMMQDAAAADVVVVKAQAPKDGRHEVLFPVGFPDEGTFDWLDDFTQRNPGYVELSDRKIIQWATQSGLWQGKHNSWKNSRDKPEMNFGFAALDDFSVRKVVNSIVSVVPRSYVVMEVRKNLLADERKAMLKKFPKSLYKRVACVAMGEPNAAYKKLVKDKLLKDKQAKEEAAWRGRKAEKERKKLAAKRAKEAAELQKKRAEEAKKKLEEAKKKAAEAKVKENDKKEEEKAPEPAKEEAKEEEKKEEKKEEEEVEEADEPAPVAKLSEEEEKQWFIKPTPSDLTSQDLNYSYGKFSIPDKAEGFDDIKFDWQDAAKSNTYLRTWVLDKKKTSKVENLVPGEWFKTQKAEWTKKVDAWHKTQKEAKSKRKKADTDDATAGMDIFAVEDVSNVGNGEPLFAKFEQDDWTLLGLRWELFTLVHAFKKDVNDEDREAIPEGHLGFYYGKYFHKTLNHKLFGQDSLVSLAKMVKDTASIDAEKLATSLAEDSPMDQFVKLTEEARRERQRRIDAGDETARLSLSPSLSPQPPKPAQAQAQQKPATAAAGTAAAAAATKAAAAKTATGAPWKKK